MHDHQTKAPYVYTRAKHCRGKQGVLRARMGIRQQIKDKRQLCGGCAPRKLLCQLIVKGPLTGRRDSIQPLWDILTVKSSCSRQLANSIEITNQCPVVVYRRVVL